MLSCFSKPAKWPWDALARASGMEKAQFCELLKSRQIPLYYYDVEDYEQDIKNLREWGRL
ncbi:MAG: UPF0175 family protein [Oscillatoria sp. Prado101]|nr:UPF0175 family protein [Oscillatoria sp. Prado101]